MARGEFYDLKPHHSLTFEPSAGYLKDVDGNTVYDEYNERTRLPNTPLTIEAHVKKLSGNEAERLGLDRTRLNLELLCADPMEGDSRIDSGELKQAALTFMGKSGTVTIQPLPAERLNDVVEAIGVKYYGTFDG